MGGINPKSEQYIDWQTRCKYAFSISSADCHTTTQNMHTTVTAYFGQRTAFGHTKVSDCGKLIKEVFLNTSWRNSSFHYIHVNNFFVSLFIAGDHT